jgi:hypothetical protein
MAFGILTVLLVFLNHRIDSSSEKNTALQAQIDSLLVSNQKLNIMWSDFYLLDVQVPDSILFANRIIRLDEVTREEIWNRMNRFMSERWRWPLLNYRLEKYSFVLDTLRSLAAPEDLIYVAIQESFLNPRAISFASAKGFWQFITTTSKSFGLKVDGYVDERLDPGRSTIAAVKLFNYLLKIFNQDWALSAAAYNNGESRVLMNMRSQGTDNYFGLVLNRETADYFLSILAWKLISERNDNFVHRFKPSVDFSIPSVEVRITIRHPLPAKTFLASFDDSYHIWRSLNPMYYKDILPAGTHLIRIPQRNIELFYKIIWKQNPLYVEKMQNFTKNLGG